MKNQPKKHITTKESALVAANFRRLRKLKGWTQFETAQKATPPVGFRYIGLVETDTQGFGKRAREKWAKVFGVEIAEFYKPITNTPWEHEFQLLKQDAQNYGYEKIKRLRELMPLLIGMEEPENASASNKKKSAARRSP